MPNYYIGLMSGTSIDGIDAVLVDFETTKSQIIAHTSVDFDKDTKTLLHELCTPSFDEINKLGCARVKLVDYEVKAVLQLLEKTGLKKDEIIAIGSHGQTIRHHPELGFTIQLDDGPRLAQKTGIDVICNFRAADIANDGNGAPLTQAFHKMQFASDSIASVVLNLGGISNLTLISKGSKPKILEAYDCGPANTLIDTATRMLLNKSFDENGEIARQGRIMPQILAEYLDLDYFKLAPPKSTGREIFNADLIKEELFACTQDTSLIPSLLNTLTELTVISSVNAIRASLYKHQIKEARVILCGGGASNQFMRERFNSHFKNSQVTIELADNLGVNSKLLEAHAFAYFAYKFINKESLELEGSTGAKKDSILGCLCPA